jgi:hypothetical protein
MGVERREVNGKVVYVARPHLNGGVCARGGSTASGTPRRVSASRSPGATVTSPTLG